MSSLFLVLTVVLMPLPLIFILSPNPLPLPVLAWTGWFIAAIYASVWLYWRPGRFELDAAGLTAVFPLRRRHSTTAEMSDAEVLDYAAFRQRYPRAMRVGAGGLWGGFGWLTTKKGWVEFYISRMDGLVLIQRAGRSPLLISPADPEGLARAINAQA